MSASATLAFLGAGNMAGAIIRGVIAARAFAPSQIAVLGGAGVSAKKLADETSAKLAGDIPALLSGADCLVLAVKPQVFGALAFPEAPATAGKLVISVMAGVTNARLRRIFPEARNIVRTMPNTPGRVGAGITPFAPESPLTSGDEDRLAALLDALGASVEVDESKMDAVIAASGSTPGWFFEIVSAFEAGAVSAGLSPVEAAVLVRTAFVGSARLLEETGETPEALRDAVTSPNGTTFAGLKVFSENRLREILASAQAACVRRAGELSEGR